MEAVIQVFFKSVIKYTSRKKIAWGHPMRNKQVPFYS